MSAPRNHQRNNVVRRKDYRPPAWLVDRVELRLELDPHETLVHARLECRRNPGVGDAGPLVLDGRDLELRSVSLDGRRLAADDYGLDDESLTLAVDGDGGVVETESRMDPAGNTELEGLYRAGEMLITQCEAEGFRRITWFPDRPDVMAAYRVRLEADRGAYPVLIANGNRVEEGVLDDGRHYAVFDDPFPKPSYLFAMVAGDLDALTDEHEAPDGRRVKLAIHAPSSLLDRLGFAMESLNAAMRFDEEKYGLACDLDEYHVVVTHDFNMGAMENKGLNIFNAKFLLASPDTATDSDYLHVEAVVGHEYFHNWTGNRVTCRDWFQLSLKEGLTVFREQQFAESRQGPIRRIDDVTLLRTGQFAEDSGPMAHPVRPEEYEEINNFYSLTVYEKGAEVVRLYHTLLGEAGFRRGMDLYFERHDGQAVTCDDFRRAMADANGRGLEQFGLWYSQAGTPRVKARTEWNSEGGEFTITLSQYTPPTPGQPDKSPLLVPVAVGLLDGDGADLPLTMAGDSRPGPTTRILELRESEQSFTFTGLEREPVPSLLRGFSAPVKLEAGRDAETLAFLLRHDSDGFARWDAAHQLKSDCLIAASRSGEPEQATNLLVEAFRSILDAPGDDLALAAELLRLPSLESLFEQVDEIRVDDLARARDRLRRRIARDLLEAWRGCHRRMAGRVPYRPEPGAMGRRRLRNLCLDYLGALRDRDGSELSMRQFEEADNLTDRLAALRVLAHDALDGAAEALDAFERNWCGDPLLRDKWFAIQATVPSADTVQRVESLLEHESFTWTNPNRARSLVGSFSRANAVGFHRADGAGYRFLADAVIRLDDINAQTAAALARPLERWRRFEHARGDRMRAELARIGEKVGLSRALGEIVRRALYRPAD